MPSPILCRRDERMERLVFIVGTGRSGSTLLTMILGAHPELFAPGEATMVDEWIQQNDLCSCGVPVLSCPIWSRVMDQISRRRRINVAQFSSAFPIDLSRSFDRSKTTQRVAHLVSVGGVRMLPHVLWRRLNNLPCFAELTRRTENTLRFYECVREVSGREHVIDASKSVYRLLHVYSLRPEAVRAIYLTRDGRATVNSLMKHTGYSAKTAALRWRNGNVYSRWMVGRIPPAQRIHVRYEELCRDPERTVKRVCGVIGVKYDPAILNFRSAEHHLIAGSPMRFGGKVDIAEDTSWRAQMSEAALGTFEQIGGRLNRKLLAEYFRA